MAEKHLHILLGLRNQSLCLPGNLPVGRKAQAVPAVKFFLFLQVQSLKPQGDAPQAKGFSLSDVLAAVFLQKEAPENHSQFPSGQIFETDFSLKFCPLI